MCSGITFGGSRVSGRAEWKSGGVGVRIFLIAFGLFRCLLLRAEKNCYQHVHRAEVTRVKGGACSLLLRLTATLNATRGQRTRFPMPDDWCYKLVMLRSCATFGIHRHMREAWRTVHLGSHLRQRCRTASAWAVILRLMNPSCDGLYEKLYEASLCAFWTWQHQTLTNALRLVNPSCDSLYEASVCAF